MDKNSIFKIVILGIISGYIVLLNACSRDASEVIQLVKDSQLRTDEIEYTEFELKEAGTLEALLGDRKATLKNMRLKGPLNAADVVCIRGMAALRNLDIKEVQIKGGGAKYYENNKLEDDKIGSYMFYGLLLNTIILPSGIIDIGMNAFCRSKITTIEIPDRVKHIGDGAFQGSELMSVNIPDGVETIGDAAFVSCHQLKFIHLPAKLKELGNRLFHSAVNLEKVEMPENLEIIGDFAFRNTALKSIDIPNTVTSIGECAFLECKSLASITIPENVRNIRDRIFENCTLLSSVVFSEGVTSLGANLFEGCKLIRTITIPSTVTSVKNNLIGKGVDNLTTIFWNAPANCTEMSIPANCLVYVSTNAVMPINCKTKIIKGEAEEIVLTNGMLFDCPQRFSAKKISFKKNFTMQTGNGEAAGWETIVLPFEPTVIKDEDGNVLTPFGGNVKGAKNFWLRELTADGFKDATRIQANKPYIIAMPNHPNYEAQYIVTGNVTFEAQNVTIKPITLAELTVQGPEFSMSPVYLTLPKANFAYAINKSNELGNNPGSVFISGLRDVPPFEAYITPNRSTQSTSMIRIQGPVRTKSIGNVPLKDRM